MTATNKTILSYMKNMKNMNKIIESYTRKIKVNDFIPFSSKMENTLKMSPIFFTLIIMYQGLLSGNSFKPNPPKNLKPAFNSPFFRFFSLFLIALSATKDIEYALVSTLIFVIVMYFIRTEDERKALGYLGLV